MGYHLDLSIPTDREKMFVPPAGREELFDRAVKVLQLGNQRTERLATMIASANHTVVDEVAVVAASLHYGRIFRTKWDGVELQWQKYIPEGVHSDFLAMAYLYRAALRQGRSMERCFDSEKIRRVQAAVRSLLGYEPELPLEELNIELFHQAIFSGIADLVFGLDAPGAAKWVDFSGRYFLRDRVSVVAPHNELLVGLVANVTTKDDRNFRYLGPVLPISVEEAVRWGKGYYRFEKSTSYEPISDSFRTVRKLSRAASLCSEGIVLQTETPATQEESRSALAALLMEQSTEIGRAPSYYQAANPALKSLAPVISQNLKLLKQLNGIKPNAEDQLRAHYQNVVGAATKVSELSASNLQWHWGIEQLSERESRFPSTLVLGESKLTLNWVGETARCVIEAERLQSLPGGEISAAGKPVYFTVVGTKDVPLLVPGTATELRAELQFRRLVSVQYLQPPVKATPFEDKPYPTVKESKRPDGSSVYWALVHSSGASYRWVPYATRPYATRVHQLASGLFSSQQKRRQDLAAGR